VTMMIVDYLEMAGYQLLTASDGLKGIEVAKAKHPALILMDIQMPGMDGLEATRRLRADPDFRTTPIIALTALAMRGDRERCLAAGATDYLAKPVSLKKLVQMIEEYLLK
jgi:CheY-like chemotaxis protein